MPGQNLRWPNSGANYLGNQPGLFAVCLSAAGTGLALGEQSLWAEGLLIIQGGLLGWVLAFGPGPVWQRLLVVWLLAVLPVWLVALPLWLGLEMLGPAFPLLRGQAIFFESLVTAGSLLLVDFLYPIAPQWEQQQKAGAWQPTGPASLPADAACDPAPADSEFQDSVKTDAKTRLAHQGKSGMSCQRTKTRLQWSMADWAMLLVLVSISLALAQSLVERASLLANDLDVNEQRSSWEYWQLLLRQMSWLALLGLANSVAILAPLSLTCKRRGRRSSSGLSFVAQTAGIAGAISSLLFLFFSIEVGLELVGLLVTAAIVPTLFLLLSGAYSCGVGRAGSTLMVSGGPDQSSHGKQA